MWILPLSSDTHWTHSTLIRRSPRNAWDWRRSWRRSWNRWTRNSLPDSRTQIRMQRWLEGDRGRVNCNRWRRGLKVITRLVCWPEQQQQDEGEMFSLELEFGTIPATTTSFTTVCKGTSGWEGLVGVLFVSRRFFKLAPDFNRIQPTNLWFGGRGKCLQIG